MCVCVCVGVSERSILSPTEVMIQLLNEAHTMAATVSIMKKHVVSTGEEEGSGREWEEGSGKR